MGVDVGRESHPYAVTPVRFVTRNDYRASCLSDANSTARASATHRNNVAWCVTSLEGGGDSPAPCRARIVHHFRDFRRLRRFHPGNAPPPAQGSDAHGGTARSRIVARRVDFQRPASERSGADQCTLRRNAASGSSTEIADSARRWKLVKGEQQVRRRWTNEHCPYIHGAGRTAVIERDHGAVRRAELSTREGGQLRGGRGARWICGQCGIGINSRDRGRSAYPLDDGVGRRLKHLRNACIPQTGVIFARAGFSLGGSEWKSGPRDAPGPQDGWRASMEIRTRDGAAELAEIRAIHISTVPTGRP